jgi:hypothetical protein
MAVSKLHRWRRSTKGNLWRRLDDGTTVTVFARRDGTYARCVHTGGETDYSWERWATERAAVAATDDWIADYEAGL